MQKRLCKLVVFGLGLVLGLSLLVGCAPAKETIPAPTGLTATETPVPASAEPSPSAPSVVAPTALSTEASSAAQFPMEIKDQLGRTVKINKVPQRIISIAPSDTEIIFALGLGYKVVGVDQFSDYPADAKTKFYGKVKGFDNGKAGAKPRDFVKAKGECNLP